MGIPHEDSLKSAPSLASEAAEPLAAEAAEPLASEAEAAASEAASEAAAAHVYPLPRARRLGVLAQIHGGLCASFFTCTYMFGPLYVVMSTTNLIWYHPYSWWSWILASPVLLSSILPPIFAPRIITTFLTPLLDYFDYEQIFEPPRKKAGATTNTNKKQNDDDNNNDNDALEVDCREEILHQRRSYLLVAQPHGVLSFVGICSAITSPEYLPYIRTAVASVVLYMPLIKHVMGIFGLCDASKRSLQHELTQPQQQQSPPPPSSSQNQKQQSSNHNKNNNNKRSVVLYVGGIAELFLSSPTEERLYLLKRKGFIKLALSLGVDIIPLYMFGNTSILTVLQTGILATLSRKLQASLTYFWGRWGLPIPRNDKLLYVGGQPLGMPHIPHPTQEDIDLWHSKYCAEVKRIFDTYKERVPQYKHKQLIIM